MALNNSPHAWQLIREASAELSAPALLPGFFAVPPIAEDEILAVFRRVCAIYDGELMSTLRVYQGGRREALEHALLAAPPNFGETLRMWHGRLAGGASTAIFLNRVERWSEAIATLAARLNYALSGGDTSNLFAVEAALLIGDYGYSPFGIHVDQGSTRVVHIPLTHVPKSLYTWPRDIYEKATGGSVPCFEPERLIPLADRHTYRAGDLFFLPASLFHIGHSPELTASLAFVLTPRIEPLPLDGAAAALANHAGTDWQEKPEARALSLDTLLTLARAHRELQWSSSFGLSAAIEYDAQALFSDFDQAFAIVPPFQILVQRGQGLAVYARGTSFALLSGLDERHADDLCTLFAVLNTGESLTLQLARHVAPSISVDALTWLIELLIARHVLVTVSSQNCAICPK
ncbi:hypothetical protein [Agrobacterium fabrum]|uniref:JmjC domain-containing protein n=1 Tax=Agrobacterium fabrum TaxID=1176649 RepID=A0A7Z7FR39_9HYPH|nr:hypothetical protein [Agrobacterium fabrum]MCR6727081.1 hypothetical protein [Agrobacterium fabrum]SDK03025.1 hypothetical protein SAMN05428983_3681 [Agrobacterium fabrum]